MEGDVPATYRKSVDVEMVFSIRVTAAGGAEDPARDLTAAQHSVVSAFAASPWADLVTEILNLGGELHFGIQMLEPVARERRVDRPVFAYHVRSHIEQLYAADFTVKWGGG